MVRPFFKETTAAQVVGLTWLQLLPALWEMFYLMEFLASHGWIIVAPDHVGNTYYASWGDLSPFLHRRPADIRDTFDWLLEQNADPTSPLSGCVDEDAGYVVSGYSFGGYTAYVTGGASASDWSGAAITDRADPRVTAVVTIAPWDAYAITDGTADIDVPVLTIGGERDDCPEHEPLSGHWREN